MQQAGPTPTAEERSRLRNEYLELTSDRASTVVDQDIPAVSDVPEGAPTESSTQGLVPQEHSTFQTFPNFEAGRQAQRDLWLTDPYQNRTVRDAIARWTGGPGKADDGYVNALLESVGAGVGDRPTPMREKMVSDVTPDELEKLLDAQQKWEGWHPGLMHGPVPEPGGPDRAPRHGHLSSVKCTTNIE